MEIKNKEMIDNKKCLVVVPTRGRPKMIKQFIKSFEDNTSKLTIPVFCMYDDDPELKNYMFHVKHWPHVILKRQSITGIFNVVVKTVPDMKYYMPSNDDSVFKTKDWDIKLMGLIEKNGGSGIAFGNDTIKGSGMCTTPVISSDFVRAVGYLQMPRLTHLYGDNVWHTIGRGTNRLSYDEEVVIERQNMEGKAIHQDDAVALQQWMKSQAKKDVSKIMNKMLESYKKTISVCMIVADSEDPKTLIRALSSVDKWVDEICIVFNYQRLKSRKKLDKLKCAAYKSVKPGFNLRFDYKKFTNFSEMRNSSLDLATKDFVLWIDTDDYVDNPWLMKDHMMRYPDVDAFKCEVHSYTEKGTKELLLHNRLFRNGQGYHFRNRLHEDVTYSMLEKKAKVLQTNIIVHHLGNQHWEDVKRKNKRNLKLAYEDMKDDPHSLNYYAIVNALMIEGGQDNNIKAIKYVDECFEKFPPNPEKPDPLTDKMLILRGLCCQKNGQHLAAKQTFHRAYDVSGSAASGINLAELYYREKDYMKVIEILNPIYANEFVLDNMAVDVRELQIIMLKKLADSWFEISKESKHKEDVAKAEQYYREFISHIQVNRRDPIFLDGGDKLAQILRNSGRLQEAYVLTINLVNTFPEYDVGWNNLGSFELLRKRYQTATLFLKKCLEINPRQEDARHNLNQIRKMGGEKK